MKILKTTQRLLTYATGLFIFANAFANNTELPMQNAQRIISLAPHLTEMVYSAGAGDKLVGVVNYSDYPKEALNQPIIGSYNAINIEKIIELQPDLILTWRSGNRLQDFERLQSLQAKLGFKVWESEVQTLTDIPKIIQQIGAMSGTEQIADKRAKDLQQQLTQLQAKYAHHRPVKTFYQIWNKPLITMGKSQFISQGILLCAGVNIFEDLGSLTGPVAMETVIIRDPEVLLMGGRESFQQEWLKTWQAYPNISAVKNQQIYLLNNSLYQRPTARFIEALEPLCQKIENARKSVDEKEQNRN